MAQNTNTLFILLYTDYVCMYVLVCLYLGMSHKAHKQTDLIPLPPGASLLIVAEGTENCRTLEFDYYACQGRMQVRAMGSTTLAHCPPRSFKIWTLPDTSTEKLCI